MNVPRLEDVIATLETVPEDQFNMEHWWLDNGEAFDEDRNIMYKVADGPCGCTIGHLIQRGMLSGEIIKPKDIPAGALPYQYRDRVFVQISNALGLHNYKVAEFLFSQYAYMRPGTNIKKEQVIKRIRFIIDEMKEVP